MNREMVSNVLTTSALNAQAIATDTTTNGVIIDGQGYDSLFYSIQSGAITDGAYAVLIEEGDESDLSDATAVADADLTVTEASVGFVAADDNAVKRIGYTGSKRFTRLSLVSTGTTSGGLFAAQAVLGHANRAPVA